MFSDIDKKILLYFLDLVKMVNFDGYTIRFYLIIFLVLIRKTSKNISKTVSTFKLSYSIRVDHDSCKFEL